MVDLVKLQLRLFVTMVQLSSSMARVSELRFMQARQSFCQTL